MSSQVSLVSVQLLDDFQVALSRFSSEAQEVLNATALEAARTLEWLYERQKYWYTNVQHSQELVNQARTSLAHCQSESRNSHNSCDTERERLRVAQAHLHTAEEELRKTTHWLKQIQESGSGYHRQAKQLMTLLTDDIPKAKVALKRRSDMARLYSALGPQQAFRQVMAEITSQERGSWGERTVVNEAMQANHRILLEHADKSTAWGYDCVSWDGKVLHIWEVKNYSQGENEKPGEVNNLNAITQGRVRANVEQFLQEINIDDPDRQAIAQAVQQDSVIWHIRLGPDTDISFKPLDNLGWASVEAYQYSYDDMANQAPANSVNWVPETNMPPEFREGTQGGAERER